MAHVVTARCAGCRYTYCAVECPVTCFWEIEKPHHMLVIDPDTCIDCEACVPACPVNAIWPDHELSVQLDQSLITAMEDQARWMIANNLTAETLVPNFLDYTYEDALKAIKPDGVKVIR